MTHIAPSAEQLDALRELPLDRPIEMLNLLRFRERADYPDDHPAASESLSGEEAYRRYYEAVGPIGRRIGLEVVWSATPALMLIGPGDERWDMAFVARYPSAQAFLTMLADPEYRAVTIHRTAALSDSRLVRCDPLSR